MRHIELHLEEDLLLGLSYGLTRLITDEQLSLLQGGTPTVSLITKLPGTELFVIPVSGVHNTSERIITYIFINDASANKILAGGVLNRSDVLHSCILPYTSKIFATDLLSMYLAGHKNNKELPVALVVNSFICYSTTSKFRFEDHLIGLENSLYLEQIDDSDTLDKLLKSPYFEVLMTWDSFKELVKISKGFIELMEYLSNE